MSDPTRSCANCPSFLTKDEVSGWFGKSIGAPMCARYGKVLGAPDILAAAQSTLQHTIAESCNKFGAPKPKEAQSYLETQVTMPDPNVIVEIATNPATAEDKLMVNSCNSCKFYVPDSDVMNGLGWGAGLCNATGRLIIPGHASKEARRCDMKKPGPWSDLENVSVIRMYQDAKDYDPSPLGQWKKLKAEGRIPEPSTYESDYPVTVEDRADGIRAWRRMTDPNGSGHSVPMPIFDIAHFTEAEQQAIPQTGDEEHPENYIDAADYVYSVLVEWMRLDYTPIMWGQPGVGKTELARHLAWLMQIPFFRLSFTQDMEVEDVIGKMTFSDGETKFQWGRLPLAWKKPTVILLDEPNAASSALWQRIRPLTDNSKQLVLDEAGGEVVKRNPFCYMIMAANPAWEMKNIGVNEMADADISRTTHVSMELPRREVEWEILKTACEALDDWTPSDKIIKGVLDNSDEIRQLVDDGALPYSWGVRENLKVIRHLAFGTPVFAYRRAVVDSMEPEAGKMITDIVTTGGRLDN